MVFQVLAWEQVVAVDRRLLRLEHGIEQVAHEESRLLLVVCSLFDERRDNER